MGTALLLTPAALSLLLLGAHYLRSGNLFVAAACLVLVGLLWMRRAWVPRVVQLALLLGSVEWFRTLDEITARRLREGEPYERTALILGSVIVVALAGVLLMGTPRLKLHYGRQPA